MAKNKSFTTKTKRELRIHEVEIINNVPSNPKIKYSEKVVAPKTLKKYYNANSYGYDVLKKGSIWATHPFDFNDPFDCAIQLWDIKKFPDNEMKIFLNKFLPNGFPSHSDILTTRRTFFELALRFIGIYCLNEGENDDLFWGYYTNHKGFSITFDTKTLNEDFGMSPLKLEYKKIDSNDYLTLIPGELIDFNIFPKILRWTTLKKLDWMHEKEWRYVFTDIDLGQANRQKQFNFKAIQKINLGHKFLPSYNFEKINGWTKKYFFDGELETNYPYQILKFLFEQTDIPLKQVVLNEDYSLTEQTIFIRDISNNQITIERN